jgi:5-methylcytosine-specific restriction enzyme subunit McrC
MTGSSITCYEFHKLVASAPDDHESEDSENLKKINPNVFAWLERTARYHTVPGSPAWVRPSRQRGAAAVELTSYVGVVRAPDGTQIEILPKIGRASKDEVDKTRALLVNMLRSLPGFKHIKTADAVLQVRKMRLLDVFIWEFLRATQVIVKRGLRGGYSTRRDNLAALRGKLQISTHLRENLVRRDRFFSEFDEFSTDRAENRLLHTALRRSLSWASSVEIQQLARELCFVFSDVPESTIPSVDMQFVKLDRDMGYYAEALAWAELILQGLSPLTGLGRNEAPSLLFPMQDVFEAYVAKHLKSQLQPLFKLQQQSNKLSLVSHRDEKWFQLKPDLLVNDSGGNACMILDTKWKLLDASKGNSRDKFGLSQSDFYQMYAYGQTYLKGEGDMVLIYPKTREFDRALAVFEFPESKELRLWVLPFCFERQHMILPTCGALNDKFNK